MSAATDATRQYWDVMYACALRFEGYDYAATRVPGQNESVWLSDLADQFLAAGTFFADPLENWGVFFICQRHLGRIAPPDPAVERAFLKLFLHFYQEPTPEAFIKAEYQRKWEQSADRIRATVQWARGTLTTS